MRDDIHNKVPLSPVFRALIRRCAMAAYQQQTDGLEPYAVKAVRRLIVAGCSPALISSLAEEAKAPNLFGVSTVSLSSTSALQSDLIAALSTKSLSVQQSLALATKNQIDGMCLEAVASLRVAGASRSEAYGVDRAMRTALMAAVDNVTTQIVGGDAFIVPKMVLSGSSTLPLGPAAKTMQ